jgi:hypothetical protein
MAAELPYLTSYKNVGVLFDRIAAAKAPETFSTTYLTGTIGLKSTADRQLIPMLKAMGFLDPNGKPLPQYALLKNSALAPGAIAAGIRRAYAPLFDSNEAANELEGAALKGAAAQVSGADASVVAKIYGTLLALFKKADFSAVAGAASATRDPTNKAELDDSPDATAVESARRRQVGLHPEFHYNIQVHLPANGSEETYLNIFNALRKSFVA